MELIINFIIGAISSICIGLSTNYIYDKIKNSSIGSRKSGLEFELRVIYTRNHYSIRLDCSLFLFSSIFTLYCILLENKH